MQIAAIEKGEFVIYFAYALIGLVSYLIARMVFAEQESRAASENLAELRDRKASSELVRVTRPFFTQYVVPIIRGKPFWDNQRKIYRRKVIAAGLKEELTADEFIAFKFFLILFFPLISGLIKAFDVLDLSLLVILGSGVAGWFYPDLWVRSLMSNRQNQILKSMPFIVDLLALSTEAGLDFVGAIGKVVEKAKPSPLVDEFAQLLKEMRVGSARQDALREMAARISMSQINSFVAILISADQMGAPIGKILRQQSEQIRTERMLRAEKAGAAASQKIIIPVMLFIIPAVFIMIMAPFAIEMMGNGGVPG